MQRLKYQLISQYFSPGGGDNRWKADHRLGKLHSFHMHGMYTRFECVANLIYCHDVTWRSWRLKSPQHDSNCNSLLRLKKSSNVFIARPLLGNPHSVYHPHHRLYNSAEIFPHQDVLFKRKKVYPPCHIHTQGTFPDASLTIALFKVSSQ